MWVLDSLFDTDNTTDLVAKHDKITIFPLFKAGTDIGWKPQ